MDLDSADNDFIFTIILYWYHTFCGPKMEIWCPR